MSFCEVALMLLVNGQIGSGEVMVEPVSCSAR